MSNTLIMEVQKHLTNEYKIKTHISTNYLKDNFRVFSAFCTLPMHTSIDS